MGALYTYITAATYGRVVYNFRTPVGCVSLGAYVYSPASNGYALYDDISLIPMDTAPLTVTLAAASSLIDGADTAVRTLSGQLGASHGEVEVAVTPVWSVALAARGQTRETLLYLYIDANNYLRVSRTANTLTLTYNAQGGGVQTGTFDLTGLWAAGIKRRIRLVYHPGGAYVLLDGVPRCVITAACVFSTAFTSIYFGSEVSGVNNADALFE